MADRIQIDYDLPISGDGHVRLIVDTNAHASQLDAEFIIDILGRFNELAQVAVPSAVAREIPAVLRGIGGRP